jgi:hypothetical protein
MYRLIISIGLFLIVASGIRAQESMNFSQINNETYRLFMAGEWDSVLVLGKTALKQDVDFYYLRIRMGIAQYNQQKYRQASGHFTRALELNHADPVALEYLYYSLLFSGQADRASLVRQEFNGELAFKLPPQKGKLIDRIGAEYLFCKGLNDELLSDPDPLFSDLTPGVQYITRHYSNASLSLSNTIVPGFRLNHAYTYLSKTNYQHYNDGLNLFLLEDQHVYQHQYYISPSITTKSGLTLMPMFHLLSIHAQVPVDFGQGFQGGSSSVTLGYLDIMNYVSGLELRLSAGTLDLHLGAWYARLDKNDEVQNRLGLTWYPLGNLNFYAGGYLNTQYEMSKSNELLRIIPELQMAYAIKEKIWLNLNVAMGEMTNYLEQNGSLVFNSLSDVIHKKVVLTISVPLTEKGSLIYLGGRWTAHESNFYPFDPAIDQTTNKITYNALSIYGGVSWKF